MRRRASCILLALGAVALSTPGWASDPRRLLKEGAAAYADEEYGAAAEAFAEAAASAEENGLDPAVALYNQSTALLKQNQTEEAAQGFLQALRTTDLDLQSKAYFNRGNAEMRMADGLQQQNQLEPAVEAVEQALGMYENAMALKPGDAAPKINYELALLKKEQLQQMQQQQQQQDQQDQDQQDQDQQDQDQQDQDQQDQQQQDENQQDENQQDQDQQNQQQDESEEDQDQQQMNQEDTPEGSEGEAQPEASEEMTPEEARMLLEAMKEEEQADREKMRLRLGQPVPVEKDW